MGVFIKQLYPGIVSKTSAFKFAFHPRTKKYFGVINELEKIQKKDVLKNGLGIFFTNVFIYTLKAMNFQ